LLEPHAATTIDAASAIATALIARVLNVVSLLVSRQSLRAGGWPGVIQL
jgi:hypothetical protein